MINWSLTRPAALAAIDRASPTAMIAAAPSKAITAANPITNTRSNVRMPMDLKPQFQTNVYSLRFAGQRSLKSAVRTPTRGLSMLLRNGRIMDSWVTEKHPDKEKIK
jgi:hypothetical protein